VNPLPEKTCVTCGRRIVWRTKWRDCWDEVKYCSERCRRHKPGAAGDFTEQAILDLLATRKNGASICASEVARLLHADDWRNRMEEARQAGRRLVARGLIEMTQRGLVVDESKAKGPVRLRLARS